MTPLALNISTLRSRISAFLATVQKPLLVVTGPTGSGKSELAVQLAQSIKGEIINADSRQMYRGMEIGVNTVPESQRQNIPHHLFSFLEPDTVFTLAQYQQAAFDVTDNILTRGHVPILAGGTGLYINAICLNYAIPPIAPDAQLRTKLEQRLTNEGEDALRTALQRVDADKASSLQKGKHRALIRALEITYHLKSKGRMNTRNTPRYDCFFIFLEPERMALKQRIERRLQEQLEQGMMDEVRTLTEKGHGRNSHAMTAIYAREGMDYREGKISLLQMKAAIITHTLSYAKRQATWFRGLQRQLPPDRYLVIKPTE